MMKKSLLTLALMLSAAALCGAEGKIKLPDPQRSGGMPIYEALNMRMTFRKFTAEKVSQEKLSTLLWAANGINRDNGKRTAPSAMNRQPIEIYVLTPEGAYFWNPADNTLELRAEADLRAAAGRFAAPMYLVLVANFNTGAKEKFIGEDCGYVSQNIYLGCAASGLGTCAIGMIADEAKLVKTLNLDAMRRILLTHVIGVPQK